MLLCYKYNMISIADALQDIVRGNPLLAFGFRHGLFNLTKLAAFLKPAVAARTKKEVQESAITMALSRLKRDDAAKVPNVERFVVDNVTIHSGLSARSYRRSPSLQQRLTAFSRQVQAQNDFCSLTQGIHELTLIFDSRHQEALDRAVRTAPRYRHESLASITVQFDARYVAVPGMLYLLLQQVTLQNVNLVEISSTYTEIMLFVSESDARLVFDTLFERFLIRSEVRP